jgi:hypothetical protein
MIEKKISYNEPKPTKVPNIKPVKQGGRLNYLGKQKTITAPVKWKSGPTHPVTHLAYITDEEQKILVDLNIYKSMNGKPNKGPFGIVSLNDGDGSGGGGDSGGGSGGSGGSDAAGDAGNATGDSAGVGGSGDSTSGEGSGSGPGGEAGTGGVGPAGDTMGSSTAQDTTANQQAAAQNVTADDVSVAAQADQEDAATAAAANAATSGIGNLARQAIQAYMTYSPIGMLSRAVSNVVGNISRGVTAPNDFSQATESVQSSAPSVSDGGGGITTIGQYAPLSNTSTGDNTQDAIRTRLENLLKVPTTRTVFQPQNINQLSNYTLADLTNLRGI